MHEFDAVIVEDETSGYIGFIPALLGCHTQGESLEELMKNLKEAIELYLETLTDEEKRELVHIQINPAGSHSGSYKDH